MLKITPRSVSDPAPSARTCRARAGSTGANAQRVSFDFHDDRRIIKLIRQLRIRFRLHTLSPTHSRLSRYSPAHTDTDTRRHVYFGEFGLPAPTTSYAFHCVAYACGATTRPLWLRGAVRAPLALRTLYSTLRTSLLPDATPVTLVGQVRDKCELGTRCHHLRFHCTHLHT